MKEVLFLLYGLFLGYCIFAPKEENKTDLEIYTKDNIYYIKHLTVTNEVDAGKKEFKNKEQLKEYISNLTAKQYE